MVNSLKPRVGETFSSESFNEVDTEALVVVAEIDPIVAEIAEAAAGPDPPPRWQEFVRLVGRLSGGAGAR